MMKKYYACFTLLFLLCTYCMACDTDTTSGEEYCARYPLIEFSQSKRWDEYSRGDYVADRFHIYENGKIDKFKVYHLEGEELVESWYITKFQLDSLLKTFDKVNFVSFPNTFPTPPIMGPCGTANIRYRANGKDSFDEKFAFLSQSEWKYPTGFFKLYRHLKKICFKEF